jgi:hypothetical protein
VHISSARKVLSARHCFAYIGQTPLGMSDTDAMKQLRGPKHENWPVCDPRHALPRLENMALKVVKMGT